MRLTSEDRSRFDWQISLLCPLVVQQSLEDNFHIPRPFPISSAKGTDMELQVIHEEGYVHAQTHGPIDDEAKELFREYLHPLIGQKGTKMILDLSQSNFISSNGIGHIVSLVAHANTNSSRVIITACTPFVGIAMNRCKLDKFFEMSDSVPSAIRMILG
jgi:anti-anti-sigma factor